MSWFQVLALFGMPVILFALGFAALKWTQWDIRRNERMHPGE
jgi:hypothetical protein